MSDIKLINKYNYKGYIIKEYQQKPCQEWIEYIQSDGDIELMGHEKGPGGYEILNHKNEIVESDFYCMGDTATENAEYEIDILTRGSE